MKTDAAKIGIVGARGHTGRELLALLLPHPGFELVFASSRQYAGQPLSAMDADFKVDLEFEEIGPQQAAARDLDALVLALPNSKSGPFVKAVSERRPECVILDLSADYRFEADWHYGLPELTRAQSVGQNRIANPGCYATAMQLALAPVIDSLAEPPVCFGVSGYSGAGSKPSPRNDPAVLADNLLGYQPVGHIHEREVSHRLDRPVRFLPHVAPFFRGISMSVALRFAERTDTATLRDRFERQYGEEKLVRLTEAIPTVANNAGRHHAVIGGWQIAKDGRSAAVYATLDNLLKGAATQALQNLNLAFGYTELEGIPCD